jgi:hypothetical protein
MGEAFDAAHVGCRNSITGRRSFHRLGNFDSPFDFSVEAGLYICGIFTGNNTAVLWCGGTSIKKRTDLRSTPWWKN